MRSIHLIMLLLVAIIITSGCTTPDSCEGGLYNSEGECCTYVCDNPCPSGYIKGTCNCVCKESSIDSDNGAVGNIVDSDFPDANIDNIFGDEDITPPVIPD